MVSKSYFTFFLVGNIICEYLVHKITKLVHKVNSKSNFPFVSNAFRHFLFIRSSSDKKRYSYIPEGTFLPRKEDFHGI